MHHAVVRCLVLPTREAVRGQRIERLGCIWNPPLRSCRVLEGGKKKKWSQRRDENECMLLSIM